MALSDEKGATTTSADLQKLPRGVSTIALVFILFFCTSGGPYTTETLIHSIGPGLGLLILLLVPIIWSLRKSGASINSDSRSRARESFRCSWIRT